MDVATLKMLSARHDQSRCSWWWRGVSISCHKWRRWTIFHLASVH